MEWRTKEKRLRDKCEMGEHPWFAWHPVKIGDYMLWWVPVLRSGELQKPDIESNWWIRWSYQRFEGI